MLYIYYIFIYIYLYIYLYILYIYYIYLYTICYFCYIVDLPLTCRPSPCLTSFAFRSREVRRLLLDLDPYGGSDPSGMFPLFLKRPADVLAARLSLVFRRLVRLGSFPACWRQANVPYSKGSTVPLC